MVRAFVQNGVIVPRDPLPEDWTEGTEVEVEKRYCPRNSSDDLDHRFAETEAIAAQGDPEDDQRLDAAIQVIRNREKQLARKKLGLDP